MRRRDFRIKFGIGVVVFSLTGAVALLVSIQAATPSANFETESGVSNSNAMTVTDGAASGGAAVQFSVTSQSLYGWQLNATNTGLAPHGLSCASLPVYAGPSSVLSGTTISQKRITIELDLSAGNIVIEKSCIQPTSVGSGIPVLRTTNNNICNDNGCQPALGPVTVRDSEFDGSLLTPYQAAFTGPLLGIATLQRNYVHDMGSGFGLMNTGKQYSSIVEGNYITKLRAYGDGSTTGNHSDGFTIRDFDITQNANRTLIVRNNRFDCSSGNDTGAFFIQTYAGDISNVTVTGNLLEGAGYNLGLNGAFGNTYTNLVATNNRFNPTGWGPAYVQGGSGWSQWADNYRNDPTKTDNKGAVVGEP